MINAYNNNVEGILVRGDTDLVSTPAGCMVSNRVPNDGGSGESVHMIDYVYAGGIIGDKSKLANDGKYRYYWDTDLLVCLEYRGKDLINFVDNGYCGR